jgi:hypothetical protein
MTDMDNLAKQPITAHQDDELVSMLRVIASQIEAALQETNAPATTLVETAHAMSNATQIVARCLFDFSGSPARVFQDLMMLHDDMHARATKATTAIQFHDRLVQYLTHVCSNLTYLAEFIASSSAPKSSAEWEKLRERVRGIQSMEQERVLFDLLSSGLSADEKQAAVAKHQENSGGTGKVELF